MPSRNTIAALAGAAVLVAAGQAGAEPSRPVTHGSDIVSGSVGLAGRTPSGLAAGEGGVIRDGEVPSYAREIAQSATYDGFSVTGRHLLIEKVRLSGSLDISTGRAVVIRETVVQPARGSFWGIQTRPGAGPLIVAWSRIDSGEGGMVAVGLKLRADDAVVYRSHVTRVIDGIHPSAQRIRIVETLVDGLLTDAAAHNDGIQMMAEARDVRVLRSKILNPHPQTSAVSVGGRQIVIEGSYLAGGGYALYGGGAGADAVQVRNVVFGRDFYRRSGNFGTVTSWRDGAGQVWEGNRFADGLPLKP